MASLLESTIRKTVATAFAGKLLTGTLRRVSSTTVDSYGDVVAGTAATYAFDGMVDTFDSRFLPAGVEATDARILIIGGSLSVTPQKDDQIKLRDQWYQVRGIVERDPANATYTMAGFEIEDPT